MMELMGLTSGWMFEFKGDVYKKVKNIRLNHSDIIITMVTDNKGSTYYLLSNVYVNPLPKMNSLVPGTKIVYDNDILTIVHLGNDKNKYIFGLNKDNMLVVLCNNEFAVIAN